MQDSLPSLRGQPLLLPLSLCLNFATQFEPFLFIQGNTGDEPRSSTPEELRTPDEESELDSEAHSKAHSKAPLPDDDVFDPSGAEAVPEAAAEAPPPLPVPWRQLSCPNTGHAYYHNTETDEVRWLHPTAAATAEPSVVPAAEVVLEPDPVTLALQAGEWMRCLAFSDLCYWSCCWASVSRYYCLLSASVVLPSVSGRVDPIAISVRVCVCVAISVIICACVAIGVMASAV